MFLVTVMLFDNSRGAMIIGGFAALIAYMVGDKMHSDQFQSPLREAVTDARNRIFSENNLPPRARMTCITSC